VAFQRSEASRKSDVIERRTYHEDSTGALVSKRRRQHHRRGRLSRGDVIGVPGPQVGVQYEQRGAMPRVDSDSRREMLGARPHSVRCTLDLGLQRDCVVVLAVV
jgi:hypothetical protein